MPIIYVLGDLSPRKWLSKVVNQILGNLGVAWKRGLLIIQLSLKETHGGDRGASESPVYSEFEWGYSPGITQYSHTCLIYYTGSN